MLDYPIVKICIIFLIWIVLASLSDGLIFVISLKKKKKKKKDCSLAPAIFIPQSSLYSLIKSLYSLLLISYAYWVLTGKHLLYSSENFVAIYVTRFSLWKNMEYTVEMSKKQFQLRNCMKVSSGFPAQCPETWLGQTFTIFCF